MSTIRYESSSITPLLQGRKTTRLHQWMKLPMILSLVLFVAAGPRTALALTEPSGALDLSFDAGNFTNGQVSAATLQPDGKLLIGGDFNKVHGVMRRGVARLDSDGTLDPSFDPGNNDVASKTMIVQPDNKIIVLGLFGGIARLNSDGSIDNSFTVPRVLSLDGVDDGSGGATSPGTAYSAVLQPDGKLVIVGRFFFVITGVGTSVARSGVARFNSDGSFDPSYNPGHGAVTSFDPFNMRVNYTARQSGGGNNGKIIIHGNFDIFDDHGVPGLARLNADGSFDPTFAPGSATFDFYVSGLFAQADDQILVFGNFTSFSGVACSGLVRLTPSGPVDSGFTTATFSNYDDPGVVTAVAQQPNGKLIVTGMFHSLGGVVANNLVRLETTGARDISLDAASAGPSAANVNVVLVRPGDGKIFAGGYFSSYGGAPRNNMAWVNGNGSVDSTFAGLSGATDAYPQVYAIAEQPDGKILVGGFFSSFQGASHYNLVRLNPDSTIDPSFDVNFGTYGSVRALHVQPDGKILITGNIQAVNGVARGRIARLNANGTLDPSFDPGTGANSTIYSVTRDSATGSIYVGGAFTIFNGSTRPRVAKLSSTGAVDPIFNSSGDGANDIVYAVTPPDGAGNIVIAGSFFVYNSFTIRRIARISATTGQRDTSFILPPTTGFNGTVRAVALAPDGKYYAGGLFSTYNNQPRSSVARLNNNGSLDTTFVGPNISTIVYTLALQHGKVLVGGFLGTPASQIVRLTSSGALDSTFDPGTGVSISPANPYAASPTVSAVAVQSDNRVLLGGIFNDYNGVPRVCLARLTAILAVSTPTPTPTPTLTPGVTPTPTPTPTSTSTPPASPTPSTSPVPTPPATPTLTPTPTSTPTVPPGTLGNISTRLRVLSGDNALIGGMIATGTAGKRVIIRAIGPSLIPFGVPGALANPTLDLFQGDTLLFSNDDWGTSTQQAEIANSGLAPTSNLESAIIQTLTPGLNYTAVVRGQSGGTGVGIVEAYDLDQAAASKLGNISTRGFVDVDDNVMIAGLIAGPSSGTSLKVLVRALGPTLSDFGVAGALTNPTLDLVNSSGTVIRSNDNWRDDPQQQGAIEAAGLAPSHDEEAALVETVAPGAYTAVVRGSNRATGVGLVEAYSVP